MAWIPASLMLLAGCVAPAPPIRPAAPSVAPPHAAPTPTPDTPPEVDVARARAEGRTQQFEWQPWAKPSFDRAARERRFILVDGAAEWCHWCHVMDETTYLDPEIGRILREHFVAIRIDVDARPDLAERYGDWGWPATIILSPDAEELGKFRGYLPPDEMRDILAQLQRGELSDHGGDSTSLERRDPLSDLPAPAGSLGWVAGVVAHELDEYYDPREGGWGQRQKAPLGANAELELIRAAHAVVGARERALFSLEKQRALIDPVWGGIYQYSSATHWNEPHFEKLMTYQAANLTAYARAFALTGREDMLADARALERYMNTFLSDADGAFLVSQDADVGTHDREAAFVDGHEYYAKDDAGRRALGLPRVDPHVYPYENGLAIAAMAALHEATGDWRPLWRANRAAELVTARLVDDEGRVWRTEDRRGPRFLADAAAFAHGLARLSKRSSDTRHRETALRIAAVMLRDFADDASGAMYASTPNPAAVGVFAKRRQPFDANVRAARALAALHALTGDARHRADGRRVLRHIATPRRLADQGRMTGEFLVACAELGVIDWSLESGADR